MRRVSRERGRVGHCEPDAPRFDEYIICAQCGDHVFEYCSIHGPLLVVPDDKVPTPSGLSPFVPRAALTVPKVFLHLAASSIPGADIGVFSTLTLPAGVRFGPYRGAQTKRTEDAAYSWQIYNREHKPSHLVDARDPRRSNWMRYVNCSRYAAEQNLAAFQYQGDIYYRTIKLVPRFTELLVFYGSEFALDLNVDLRRYHAATRQTDSKDDHQNKSPEDGGKEKLKIDLNINTTNILDDNDVSMDDDIDNDVSMDDDIDSKHLEDEHGINEESVHESMLESSHYELSYNIDPHHLEEATEQSNFDEINKIKQDVNRDVVLENHDCETGNHNNDDINKENANTLNKKKNEGNMHACTQCNYKCVSAYRLKIHMRRHSGDKPYKCDICNYASVTKYGLTRHSRSHTGDKPYKCDSCNFAGVTNCTLKRHQRLHTGEKPYRCIKCESGFLRKDKLTSHMILHSREENHTK